MLDGVDLGALRGGIRGAVLGPGDPGYDEARGLHNGMIDRRPAVIVRAAGAVDVAAAVGFAREGGLPLAVKGGGHGVAGHAVCEGGVTIDLGAMKGVSVDPAAAIARVEGGAAWGDLDPEAHAFGLATTGGAVRTTGVAGLTLGGGHGFLMRRFGLACDNLLAVELVTADGSLVRVDAEREPELLWGVKGGGGMFGVAVGLELRLHPLAAVIGGLLVWPGTESAAFLRHYRDLAAGAPDTFGSFAALARLPDGTPVVAIIFAASGARAEGDELLARLRAFGPPLLDRAGPMAYPALQAITEEFNPRGHRNYWRSNYLEGLSDAAIAALAEGFAAAPPGRSHIIIEHLGGALAAVPEAATAYGYRGAPFNLHLVGMWEDPALDGAGRDWVNGLWQAMQGHCSRRVYLNYLGAAADEPPGRVQAAFGEAKYRRLAALKARWDPANLFALNQNIAPPAA